MPELSGSGFEVVDVTPWEELEPLFRQIPLHGQPDTRPYEEAEISIERFKLSKLWPTTRYVQADLLETQARLREDLLPQGYDQLDLQAGRLVLARGSQIVRLAPPIVERYEDDGDHKYVLDGSHRSQLAWQIGSLEGAVDPELTVVYVRNGIKYPPYARPNLWGEVKMADERPVDKEVWKNYRKFSERYTLYRDYSSILDSQPRGLDEPAH